MKAQLNELKARFFAKFGETIFDEIEFNTTDAFQGREREIIIFSCVRAKATGGIGFLGDIRRMNVGLTRAKSSLWVLGDSNALQQGEFWNRLIQDSQKRDRYTGGDVLSLLSKPTSRDRQSALPQGMGQVNGNQRQSTSAPSAAPSSILAVPRRMLDDDDVEMIDAPSLPGSRKPSASGSSSSSDTIPNGNRPRDPAVQQESRKWPLGGSSEVSVEMSASRSRESSGNQDNRKPNAFGLNLHGKRSREPSKDEDGPGKKAHPPKDDLEAALQAQQAAKRAAPARSRPVGVMAPRRKPAADPFIQKKRK